MACCLITPSHYLIQCWFIIQLCDCSSSEFNLFKKSLIERVEYEIWRISPGLNELKTTGNHHFDKIFDPLTHCGLVTPYGHRQHESESTLAQVMACCLMASSHYQSQCWLAIGEVLWHSPEGNYTMLKIFILNIRNEFENYTLKLQLHFSGANGLSSQKTLNCEYFRESWQCFNS